MLEKFDMILGLKINEETTKTEEKIPQKILELIEKRKEARENKDWNESDRLRDEIQAKGYQIKDISKDEVEIIVNYNKK